VIQVVARSPGRMDHHRQSLEPDCEATGSVSALPVRDKLVAGDLPSHTHVSGDVTSGALALARGGAGADLSAT
jgi:hypothetical protein